MARTSSGTHRPARFYPLERVQNYTDAVFAIAATLLVLDLTTSFGVVDSDAQLWDHLEGELPSFLAFFVSFVLLSLLWMIHLTQFHDIARVDGVFVWLNNFRLLFIVLIPFTTSLNSQYGSWTAARLFLPLDFFLASVLSLLAYLWAAARGGHLLRDEAKADAPLQLTGGVAAVVAGAITVALSPFIGSLAFLAYVLNPPLQAMLLVMQRRRHPSAGSPPAAPGDPSSGS